MTETLIAIPAYFDLPGKLAEARKEIALLKNENDALRAAHVFYGNEENYKTQCVNGIYEKPKIIVDRGETSRKILADRGV